MISNIIFLIFVQPIVLILNIIFNLALILGPKSCSTKWVSSDKAKQRNNWFWVIKLIYPLLSPLMFIIYFEALFSKIITTLFSYEKKKVKSKGKVNPFVYEMH